MRRWILALAVLGCDSKPDPPPTCAEKALDRYERCMGRIGTKDVGCRALAEQMSDECREAGKERERERQRQRRENEPKWD